MGIKKKRARRESLGDDVGEATLTEGEDKKQPLQRGGAARNSQFSATLQSCRQPEDGEAEIHSDTGPNQHISIQENFIGTGCQSKELAGTEFAEKLPSYRRNPG